MARLVPRDGFVKEANIKTQAGTTQYSAGRDGMYKVDDPAHVKALKAEGFVEGSLSQYTTGDAQRGYNCTQCGFGSWFRLCSRCGYENISTPQTDGEINGDSGIN